MISYKINKDNKFVARFIRTEEIEASNINYLKQEMLLDGEVLLDAIEIKDGEEVEHHLNDEFINEELIPLLEKAND